MASKKTTKKSAKKKTASASASTTATADVVMWLRLPRPMTAAELSKMGLKGDICFGGDTCIVATNVTCGSRHGGCSGGPPGITGSSRTLASCR